MFNLPKLKIEYLVGSGKINQTTLQPFDKNICDFLNEFSNKIILSKFSIKFPDLIGLAFWCRNKNLLSLKSQFYSKDLRFGKGLVFHITPSNVPTNFVYSLIFGLLAGNTNLVKVPSKNFFQIEIICKTIKEILKKKKYRIIKQMITIIRYNDQEINLTELISEKVDLRVIWGGDKTINKIKLMPLKPSATDITFADRYSLSCINSKKILNLNSIQLNKLTSAFYNDTYLMDQNACSSPQTIIWLGDSKTSNKAKNIFWKSLNQKLKNKYNLPDIAIVDKLNQLCLDITNNKKYFKNKVFSNYLHTVEVKNLDKEIHLLKGKWGYFYESNLKSLDQVSKVITKKVQTITYFGYTKSELSNFVINNKILGVDRIVPIGFALDISLNWDGYNTINHMSRVIEIN